MLTRLAATLRGRPGVSFGDGIATIAGEDDDRPSVVLDDNCTVCLSSEACLKNIANLFVVGDVIFSDDGGMVSNLPTSTTSATKSTKFGLMNSNSSPACPLVTPT